MPLTDVYQMLADALRERDELGVELENSQAHDHEVSQQLDALLLQSAINRVEAEDVAPTPPVAAGAGTLDDTGPDGMTDEEFAQTVQITREPLPDGMRQAVARLTEEAMAGTAPTGPHPEFPMMSEQPVPGTSGAPHEPPPTGRPDRPPAQIQHPTRPVHVPQS